MSTTHHMKLQDTPFEKMKSGEKNIELRLYDEKRRALKIGDSIIFTNKDTSETLKRRVIGLVQKNTFSEIFDSKFLPKDAGFNDTDDVDGVMKKYYSQDLIMKYGVLGITLEK